jgi:peptide chain release factor 2
MLQSRAKLKSTIDNFKKLESLLADTETAIELAKETSDAEFINEAHSLMDSFKHEFQAQEFICKMRGEHDNSNAVLEINSGAGGTESQDWADMLLRMYLRWAEKKGFKTEVLDYHAGEGAGIKSASIYVEGAFSYGFLKCEQGVHRLVRLSPFDSNNRRHTSFASVAATPDIEEDIKIEINEADLQIDTYRSSGAGGQHVNKTDSAVRITHRPSGIVVACQNERSQHKNKDRAMKILKSKLYELEQQKQAEKMDSLKGERKKIDFGSQIRSYVLHPYQLVKDLRTDCETSNTGGVLDGDIDAFIEAYLLSEYNQ